MLFFFLLWFAGWSVSWGNAFFAVMALVSLVLTFLAWQSCYLRFEEKGVVVRSFVGTRRIRYSDIEQVRQVMVMQGLYTGRVLRIDRKGRRAYLLREFFALGRRTETRAAIRLAMIEAEFEKRLQECA